MLSENKDSAWAQRKSLEIINVLTDTGGQKLVSGDGIPDLWIEQRMWLGLRLSAALASSGDKDGAYRALEETVELLETAFRLPAGTKLTYRTPTLDRYRVAVKTRRNAAGLAEIVAFNGTENAPSVWCTVPRAVLTERSGWEWFDPIRNETRFIALTERLKNLIPE